VILNPALFNMRAPPLKINPAALSIVGHVVLWFPDDSGEIVIVFGGNKHPNHELWYDRATRESEAAVDQLVCQRSNKPKG
jgi:hypothetical protein